jgi:hypothetical protein
MSKQSMAAARKKRKAIIIAYLQDHPCVECGFADVRALEFHHRDRTEKVAAVGAMVNSNQPVGAILEEIEKCDVLCSNCHRIHHAKERGELP